MLDRISIPGFQCHKGFEIELDRINVFIGDNDAGKSALLRALKWLMLNKWDGTADQMIPWGEDKAEVCGVFDGTFSITRLKGPKENGYVLNGEALRAGVGVPDEIAKIINIREDNFQDQDDPNFWLMLNSGQASQALNEIFNLSSIDSANEFIRKELRDTRSLAKSLGTLIDESTVTKTNMEWVVEADKAFRELESLAKQIQAAQDEADQISHILHQMVKCDLERDQAQVMKTFVEDLLQAAQELRTVTDQISRHNHLIQHEENLCHLQKTLSQKESQLAEWLQQTCPLCGREAPPSLGSQSETCTSPKKPPSPAPSKGTGSLSRKAT